MFTKVLNHMSGFILKFKQYCCVIPDLESLSKNLVNKIVPIFLGVIGIKKSYNMTKIPLGYSFQYKNLLIFTCKEKKIPRPSLHYSRSPLLS